jgi:hypothetical protein
VKDANAYDHILQFSSKPKQSKKKEENKVKFKENVPIFRAK